MAGWHLDTKMAQDIVARTMRIIDTNINVMDARGRIIGSGDRERIGELHEGALLVLSQGRVVDIDDAVARHLHGVRQGINLPLRLEGEIVGVIGLTGEPENLRKYGELVCMTAEMMLDISHQIKIKCKKYVVGALFEDTNHLFYSFSKSYSYILRIYMRGNHQQVQ